MRENVLSPSTTNRDGFLRRGRTELNPGRWCHMIVTPTDLIYPPLPDGIGDIVCSYLGERTRYLCFSFYSTQSGDLPPFRLMFFDPWDFTQIPKSIHSNITLNRINAYMRQHHCPSFKRPTPLQLAYANRKQISPQISSVIAGSITADVFGSAMSSLTSMQKALPKKYHGALSGIEDIVLCLTSLSGVTSYLSATTILLSYAKTHFSTSICETIASCFSAMETQAGDAVAAEPTSFADSMKWLRSNWERCCHSKFFGHISKFLGLLVMGNVCEASSLTFTVHGFEILAPDMMKEHQKSLSVIGAIFDTVTYLVEKCHACYTTGSLKPILFDDAFGVELTDDYHRCLMWNDAHKNGNLEKLHNRQPYELLNLMYDTGNRLAQLSKESKGVERALIDRKVLEIAKMTSDFCNQLGTKLRKAPLVVQIYGPSKQGKSTLMELIISVVLAALGIDDNPMLRGVVNPEEAFMSSWLTNMMVAIIDDFGQALPGTVKNNIGSLLIAMGNNVPFCVPKAGVDEKGKVYFEPFLIIITCNVLHLHAKSFVTCPYALQRRCHVVLDVRARDRFQDTHEGTKIGLSSAKVSEYYNGNIPAIPDLWNIDLKRAIEPANLTSIAPYVLLTDSGGKKLKNINVMQALHFLSDYAIQHFKEQTELVERTNNKPTRCLASGCKRLALMCSEHNPEEAPVPDAPLMCVEVPPETPTEDAETVRSHHTATNEFYAEEKRSRLVSSEEMLEAERFHPPAPQEEAPEEAPEVLPRPAPPVVVPRPAPRKPSRILMTILESEGFNTLVIKETDDEEASGVEISEINEEETLEPEEPATEEETPVVEEPTTPHAGVLEAAFRTSREILTKKIEQEVFGFKTQFDNGAALVSLTAARYFCSKTRWLQLVPTQWVKMPWFKNLYYLMNAEEMKRAYMFRMMGVVSLSVLSYGVVHNKAPTRARVPAIGAIFTIGGYCAAELAKGVQQYYCEKLVNQNNVSDCVRKWRDEHGKNILKASAGVLAMYTIAQFYKSLYPVDSDTKTEDGDAPKTLLGTLVDKAKSRFVDDTPKATPHGNIVGVTEKDISERDATADVWKKVEAQPRTAAADAKTVQPAVLSKVVQRNLYHAILTAGDKKYFANVLFLTSNVYVLPRHYFEKSDKFEMYMFNSNPGNAGNGFRTVLTQEYAVCMNDCDLAVCYSPNGGSMRNLIKHLPESNFDTAVPFIGSWRDSKGELLDFTGYTEPKMVKNGNVINKNTLFFGGHYKNLSCTTFSGMCGAVVVSERKGSQLLGIHVGGVEGTPVGCYMQLPKQRILDSIVELDKRDGISVTTQAGDFPTSFGGVNFWSNAPLHTRSPLRYMPMTSSMQYHGSVIGRSTPRTSVKPTVISTAIVKYCGVENVWGGPKVNPHWEPYQKCLSNLCTPSNPFPPELVSRAYRDYVTPLKSALSELPSMRAETPLPDSVNINGEPGKKFIDALVLSTARGFPFSGKKSEFIVDMEKVGEREFTEEAKTLISDYEAKLESGERGYAVAKACTKDEVLPTAKGKCRIFYSSAFTLIVVSRRYYLPVLRFLQMHPALAECAVGTNCHGTDWQELHTFIVSHGSERLLAGDYSKYDQTLPTQLLIAALSILCDLAAFMKYEPRHLKIMRNMIGDLVYPMIAFNGDMISPIEGGWISGVPMTVHVNGICGSLLQRLVFFDLYPKADDFRTCVHLVTYGDDNAGSVAAGYDKFNIESVSKYLGQYGMVYTMPDKESKLTKYLPLKEMEFLKRKSTYIPEIDRLVGSLDERSIFKSLHCQVHNKGDDRLPAEKAGELIDGALREWFFHGRDVFERRLGEMRDIAEEVKITRHVLTLDLTFDERVLAWKQKYDPRSNVGGSNQNEVEECTTFMDTITGLGQDLEGLSVVEES